MTYGIHIFNGYTIEVGEFGPSVLFDDDYLASVTPEVLEAEARDIVEAFERSQEEEAAYYQRQHDAELRAVVRAGPRPCAVGTGKRRA